MAERLQTKARMALRYRGARGVSRDAQLMSDHIAGNLI
jgi:hypothetical protein